MEPHHYFLNGDNAFVLHDVGVAILSKPTKLNTYGKLPQANVLDQFTTELGTQDVTFTAVGYGQQQSFPDSAACSAWTARMSWTS